MRATHKFLLIGAAVLGTAGYLMASSIQETGVYYLTPSELSAKLHSDPDFYDVGVKVGARVVPRSIVREPGGRSVSFRVFDSTATVFPVTYRGLIPDTFTDSAEVVVEGRMGRDGTFRATTLLAKCASRYEAAPARTAQAAAPPAR